GVEGDRRNRLGKRGAFRLRGLDQYGVQLTHLPAHDRPSGRHHLRSGPRTRHEGFWCSDRWRLEARPFPIGRSVLAGTRDGNAVPPLPLQATNNSNSTNDGGVGRWWWRRRRPLRCRRPSKQFAQHLLQVGERGGDGRCSTSGINSSSN
ncbi:unnamed protein product, partial [Scytosiphon promiscuus]